MRSSKAVVNQAASLIGFLIVLSLALGVAIGLGFASFFLSQPGTMTEAFRRGAAREGFPASAELIFFSIFAFIYLMWATVPLSLGNSKQFDAGRLLMYPISLRKLFAIDFLSEITGLQSMFAIPSIIAMCLGAGFGSGNFVRPMIITFPIILFGIALSKWLSTTIGSLVKRQRARGETIIAFVGAIAGIGAALVGQIGPMLIRHAESFGPLRWTPPGAAAFLLTGTKGDPVVFGLTLLGLLAYSAILILMTYFIARRAALGMGGHRRRKVVVEKDATAYSGWQLPIVSSELSAIIEKEFRYASRNAQLRMMAMMPLILVVVRFVNSKRFGSAWTGAGRPSRSVFSSGELLPTFGVLYVFLVLAGISCNLFAFEEGGMRTLILSPIERYKILVGKNVVVTAIAALFSTALLTVNGIVFRDMTVLAIFFAFLSFINFSALMSLIGNWFSMSFPKRMQFGKRLNVTGLAGLLLIPMILSMMLPPFAAIAVGYIFESEIAKYLTIGMCALLSVGFYIGVIPFQGQSLARNQIQILEAVKEPE